MRTSKYPVLPDTTEAPASKKEAVGNAPTLLVTHDLHGCLPISHRSLVAFSTASTNLMAPFLNSLFLVIFSLLYISAGACGR